MPKSEPVVAGPLTASIRESEKAHIWQRQLPPPPTPTAPPTGFKRRGAA